MSEDAGLSKMPESHLHRHMFGINLYGIYTHTQRHSARPSQVSEEQAWLLDEALDTASLEVRRDEKREAAAWYLPTWSAGASLVF